MGQNLTSNLQCCAADVEDGEFHPGASFLPPRESREKTKPFRSVTPSSQIGGAEVDSDKSGVKVHTVELDPDAYHALLKKISSYDEEFVRMKESMDELQDKLDSMNQTAENSRQDEVSSILQNEVQSDIEAPKLSIGSNELPKADTISTSPSVGGKSETSKCSLTKYTPIETPEIRKEKFQVYKAGPRDIGRIGSWKPAEYDVKVDDSSFLKERITVAKPKEKTTPKYGKFHVHKEGPRDIGRIKGWKPANYGIDLKALAQEDFLKERTSKVRVMNKRKDLEKNMTRSSPVIDMRKRRKSTNEKASSRKSSSTKSTKSETVLSETSNLEPFSTTPVTISPMPHRPLPPTLPPRPTRPSEDTPSHLAFPPEISSPLPGSQPQPEVTDELTILDFLYLWRDSVIAKFDDH